MNFILVAVLVLIMGGVLYVLARGVIGMASGKDPTGEQSQKWMQRRVLLQGAAILVILAILYVASASSH
jgi:hypothetical protein